MDGFLHDTRLMKEPGEWLAFKASHIRTFSSRTSAVEGDSEFALLNNVLTTAALCERVMGRKMKVIVGVSWFSVNTNGNRTITTSL